MYPIREQKNKQERERLLTLFMERTLELFPDFMEARSFRRLVRCRNPFIRLYQKISLSLLAQRKYHIICKFWGYVI